jgi:hypothetical protein
LVRAEPRRIRLLLEPSQGKRSLKIQVYSSKCNKN